MYRVGLLRLHSGEQKHRRKKPLILVLDLPQDIIGLGEVGSKQCKYLDEVAGLHVKKWALVQMQMKP